MGELLSESGFKSGIIKEHEDVFVKIPVFSFEKLRSVDTTLGPEMKSTGVAIGYDKTLEKALYKGLIASGIVIKFVWTVLISIAVNNTDYDNYVTAYVH